MFFQLTLLACLLVGSLSADSGLKTAASSSNTRAYFVSNFPRTHTRPQVAQPAYDPSAASASHFQPAAYRPRPVATRPAAHHHRAPQPTTSFTRELPTTSFTCADKPYIPGIYADVQANCEVYHYCTPSFTYSFACGEGTVFNQKILSCDYPNSSSFNHSCAETPQYYSTTAGIGVETGLATPEVPKTSFTCQGKPFVPGFYADMQTGCNSYHVCVDDQQFDFNCAEGTVFSQESLTCTYATEVNCQQSEQFYSKNAGIGVPSATFNSAYNQPHNN